MTRPPEILCIGAALWDVIGRTTRTMPPGADMPGRMTRHPGGVALNIALALARQGLRAGLLAAVGRDAPGEALVAESAAQGVETGFLTRPETLPTDTYMAIEDPGGLIAAIADSHTLEAVGLEILAPLADGRLGSEAAAFSGMIALDGGLGAAQLAALAEAPILARADLRLVPASTGKATRLAPFLQRPGTCFYVNRLEAERLCEAAFPDAPAAAQAMLAHGAARAIVTDGARAATDATAQGLITLPPPKVQPRRVTGAGDSFMAAHMAQEWRGASRSAALAHALRIAADHVASQPET